MLCMSSVAIICDMARELIVATYYENYININKRPIKSVFTLMISLIVTFLVAIQYSIYNV